MGPGHQERTHLVGQQTTEVLGHVVGQVFEHGRLERQKLATSRTLVDPHAERSDCRIAVRLFGAPFHPPSKGPPKRLTIGIVPLDTQVRNSAPPAPPHRGPRRRKLGDRHRGPRDDDSLAALPSTTQTDAGPSRFLRRPAVDRADGCWAVDSGAVQTIAIPSPPRRRPRRRMLGGRQRGPRGDYDSPTVLPPPAQTEAGPSRLRFPHCPAVDRTDRRWAVDRGVIQTIAIPSPPCRRPRRQTLGRRAAMTIPSPPCRRPRPRLRFPHHPAVDRADRRPRGPRGDDDSLAALPSTAQVPGRRPVPHSVRICLTGGARVPHSVRI